MEGSTILRDRTRITRLLILREFTERPRTPLRDVAGRLGVTVQAVSQHVQAMEEAGLVRADDGTREPTAAGVQALQEGLADLKRAVDEAVAALARVDVTAAVAGTPLREGDAVGLFMEGGELVARAATPSASRGRAVHAAKAGEEVAVRDLVGVVDLKPGRITVLELPTAAEGGGRVVAARELKAYLREHRVAFDRVAATGVGGRLLAKRAGLGPDVVHAPVDAAFHAAELGLDVLLLAARDEIPAALAKFEERNRGTLAPVTVRVLPAPRGEA